MRYFSAFAALLSAALFCGCQTCTTPSVPIVGDSMSQWSPAEASCSTLPPTVTASIPQPCSGCNQPGCRGECLKQAFAKLSANRRARVASGIYDDFGTANCLGCGGCGMDNCGGGCGAGACGAGGCGAGACGAGACGAGARGAGGGVAFAGGRLASGPGCGGNVCNGSCGGRCGIAQMKAMAKTRLEQNKLVNFARRHCAYGACGGSLGPQYGQVTFPYYTVRGPRDFLNPNPPSIGP